MVPPWFVRRLLVTPLVVIGAVAVVALSPLLLTAAGVLDAVQRRRWRAVRLAALGVVFSVFEALGLLAMLVLWIASGFGLLIRRKGMQRAHLGVLKWWLDGVSKAILSLLGLEISYTQGERGNRPVLVFSRHAGPGDSVFLTRTVAWDFDRRPAVVGRRELQWAPFFDVIGHRLPHHFVTRNPQDRDRELEAIRNLAAGLDGNSALVLFPEGGNFTVRRRDRAISSLERRGHWDRATRATDMPNLIAPRPGGAMAAMEGAPDADVIFVAHSGLEDLGSLSDIWHLMPLNRRVQGCYWRVTPDQRPTGRQEQIDWLFAWWKRIDGWIEENRPAQVTAPQL